MMMKNTFIFYATNIYFWIESIFCSFANTLNSVVNIDRILYYVKTSVIYQGMELLIHPCIPGFLNLSQLCLVELNYN